jgi:REP element-mobilizing transposase RayT
MPRANRHYIPGCVWHITHRCHKQEFLLKFAHDRRRYLHWLFEAKKRFGLKILNYVVTSNHIHLLVLDGGQEAIPPSLQLIAGRTAQEFNPRKNRKGAFWEDRYHATAIEAGHHLHRCITYIDLNMVRAGKVAHPSQWPASGYHEIQHPPERYALIDREALMKLCGIPSREQLSVVHRQWIEEALGAKANQTREAGWSESIAVGGPAFLEGIKGRLRKVRNREISSVKGICTLREPLSPYSTIFYRKNGALSLENTYLWAD